MSQQINPFHSPSNKRKRDLNREAIIFFELLKQRRDALVSPIRPKATIIVRSRVRVVVVLFSAAARLNGRLFVASHYLNGYNLTCIWQVTGKKFEQAINNAHVSCAKSNKISAPWLLLHKYFAPVA